MPPALIAAGIGAAGSIGSTILSNKRQNKDRDAYNAKMDPNSYPPGSPMREFLEGRTYDTTNTSDYSGMSSTTGDYGSTTRSLQESLPFLLKEYGPLGELMRTTIEGRLKAGGLPAGYEAGGIRAINESLGGVEESLKDKLTSSGLLGGPGEAQLLAGAERARGGQIADFRTQLPLVARSLQNEDLNIASMLANMFGKGTRTSGTSTTRGYQNSLTNTMGSNRSTSSGGVPPGLLARIGQPYAPAPQGVGEQLFSSLPELAMFLYGTGAFGGAKGGGSRNWGYGPAGPPPAGGGGQY